jgi:hypothetical protein
MRSANVWRYRRTRGKQGGASSIEHGVVGAIACTIDITHVE